MTGIENFTAGADLFILAGGVLALLFFAGGTASS